MKYIFILLFFIPVNFVFSQNNFSIDFLSLYATKLAEHDQSMDLEKIQKMLEKQKLNNVLVHEIYASFFNYEGVDQSNRTLLLAYALEYELINNIKFYKQESNLLLEKSFEVFSSNWAIYSEGANLKDEALALFVTQELKRLENSGIDIQALKLIE